MKSQSIRVRNLPKPTEEYQQIRIKPIWVLILMMVLGVGLLIIPPHLYILGITIILVAVFGLLVMPDKVLLEFTKEYLVLYNERERGRCNLIYYEDIVSWHYEWHASYDQLVILLVDGTTQIQEVYSKLRIKKYFDLYAPGKESKNTRIKRN